MDVTWNKLFKAKVTLDLEVKPNEQGQDELTIITNLSEQARGLDWKYKVALLQRCSQALAKMGMHIMRENGFEPDSLPSDNSKQH